MGGGDGGEGLEEDLDRSLRGRKNRDLRFMSVSFKDGEKRENLSLTKLLCVKKTQVKKNLQVEAGVLVQKPRDSIRGRALQRDCL